MNQQLEPLTVNAVERIATDLLALNGSTTTLEIKDNARAQGYHAVQAAVAQSMYLIWEVRGWHWTFNGIYRTYYPTFEDAEAAYNAAPDGEIHQTSWLGWLSATYYQQYYQPSLDPASAPVDPVGLPRKDPVITQINKAWAGDWMLYDYQEKTPSAFLRCDVDDYEEARAAVRTYYSRLEGIPRERVGAARVKGVS